MPKSQEKMKAVKERLFQSAMELFEQKGFEQTTVLEITRKAGVSKGTFFTHYKTKNDVFSAIGGILNEYIEMCAEQGFAENWSTKRIFARCIQIVAEWCGENRKMVQMVLLSGMYRSSMGTKSTDNRRKLTSRMIEIIKRGQERGDIRRDLEPSDGAAIIVGLYFTIMFDWINDQYTWSIRERMEGCMDLLYRGFAE